MRRLLFALLLLALPSPAVAALSFTEYATGGSNVTPGALTVGFTATPTGGLITCGVRVNTTGRTVTITDTSSNTYTQVGTYQGYNSGGDEFSMWYAKNATTVGSAVVLTVSISGATGVFIRAACMSHAGVGTGTPFDKTNQGSGSSTSPSTGSVTTTCANEVLIMWGSNSASRTWTAGTGFTSRGTTEVDLNGSDDIVSATGTITGTATLSATSPWAVILGTFADTNAPCSAGVVGRPRRSKGPF